MQITRYEPPRGAETRFETNGVKVTSEYILEPSGAGTRLTQTLEAKAGGLTGRMLIPVVQGRLEQKLTKDLQRLTEVLAG
jgi:carbon monoxide dehydrogenase subunit G